MKTLVKYNAEMGERAVRMILECRPGKRSEWSVIESIAAKIGCGPQALARLGTPASASLRECAGLITAEAPLVFSASGNLVKSVFEQENGLEEAVFRRVDYRFFAAGGDRCSGQGIVPAAWLQ